MPGPHRASQVWGGPRTNPGGDGTPCQGEPKQCSISAFKILSNFWIKGEVTYRKDSNFQFDMDGLCVS